MIRYLYINGELMPEVPSSAAFSRKGENELIKLSDGDFSIIPGGCEPESISVVFPVYSSRKTHRDSRFHDCCEIKEFLSSALEDPFEIVLAGEIDGGISADINMTAVLTSVSFSVHGERTDITLKARKYPKDGEAYEK